MQSLAGAVRLALREAVMSGNAARLFSRDGDRDGDGDGDGSSSRQCADGLAAL